LAKLTDTRIKTWKQFGRRIRANGCNLLKCLSKFPDAVLVSGCQRSGTTILSRVISQSEGMTHFQFGHDDELDAALILAGAVDSSTEGRFCFQTTYVNECYKEYLSQDTSFKLIWVHRNPHSVVYSLLHNWESFPLNELFIACGVQRLPEKERIRYDRFGVWGFSKLYRACQAYNGKVSQVFELSKELGPEGLMIIDYDDLVKRKFEVLPEIYRYIDLPYKRRYAELIHEKSVSKADRLSKRERNMIQDLCVPIDEKVREILLASQ
jgi:hypothetical protein